MLVELRWAREKQFRPIVLLLSPLAITLTTITVVLNFVAVFDEPTVAKVLRRYLFQFWNAVDIVVVIVLWVKLFEAYKPPSTDAKDGDGFDNIDNDGKTEEWYYLVILRSFHLLGLARGIAPAFYLRVNALFEKLLQELNLAQPPEDLEIEVAQAAHGEPVTPESRLCTGLDYVVTVPVEAAMTRVCGPMLEPAGEVVPNLNLLPIEACPRICTGGLYVAPPSPVGVTGAGVGGDNGPEEPRRVCGLPVFPAEEAQLPHVPQGDLEAGGAEVAGRGCVAVPRL